MSSKKQVKLAQRLSNSSTFRSFIVSHCRRLLGKKEERMVVMCGRLGFIQSILVRHVSSMDSFRPICHMPTFSGKQKELCPHCYFIQLTFAVKSLAEVVVVSAVD